MKRAENESRLHQSTERSNPWHTLCGVDYHESNNVTNQHRQDALFCCMRNPNFYMGMQD